MKYLNRDIIFTDTNIISIEIKNGLIDGMVVLYDRNTGMIQRSCEYDRGLPCGMYCQYTDNKISYKIHYVSPEYIWRETAEKCATFVLDNP
jgi:antitoxin component YwqK of YwqJK toxin-antitoxin module